MTRIAHLPHRALLRITGPDWAGFLKGLCTAHIDRVAEDMAAGRYHRLHYGAFLRPQGKLYADCLIQAAAADEIWLDVALSARDEVLSRLTMYKLRAKVTIEAMDRPVHVAFGGDLPEGFAADPRSSIIDSKFGFAYSDHAPTADALDWAVFRYQAGLSDPGHDFGMDELYAIDANLDLLDAIDFHKGCYVGQELTSRMKRRGQIKNRILPFRYENHPPANNTEVLNGDKRAGNVLIAEDGFGLALMRLDRLSGTLSDSFGTIDLIIPDWIAPHLPPPEAA